MVYVCVCVGAVKRRKDDELEEDMVDGEYDAFM